MYNCLEKADQNGFASVAMPALGSGFLKFPCEVIAVTTIRGVKEFAKDHGQSSVRDVKVIVFPGAPDFHKIENVSNR